MQAEPQLQTDYLPLQTSLPAAHLRRDSGLWLLSNRAARQQGWHRLRDSQSLTGSAPILLTYDVVKRGFDITIAMSLLALLSPCMALLWLLVKIDSSGPAMFRQTRIGRDGRPFLIWKFRSMHDGVPAYARSPSRSDDARITRLGRLIRQSCLDELPQLINVLRGEMSLVGPRPEMPFIVATYSADQRRRLDVTPGMTGLWQVSPGRIAPIHENLHLDLHYIHHRSCVLDVVILVRTLGVLAGGTAEWEHGN